MDDKLGQRLREARARSQARYATVDEGTAPAEVYEALDVVASELGDAADDDARQFATWEVVDAYAKADREEKPFDARATGERVAARIAQTQKFMKEGGVAGMLRSVLKPNPLFNSVRMDLDAARPLSPLRDSQMTVQEPEEIIYRESPIAAWREESADRAERQIDALQRLVNHAEAQNKVTIINLVVGSVAALAAVAAVIVTILVA